MSLITLTDATLAFGHKLLLDHANLQIEERERVCLVGRNGTGKSTLLNVVRGAMLPDEGSVWRRDTSEASPTSNRTYRKICRQRCIRRSPPAFRNSAKCWPTITTRVTRLRMATTRPCSDWPHLQQRIDSLGGWNLSQRVEEVLSRLALPPDVLVSACSGGTRRRVMLAQALVSDPDVLLLDEPTNHMDIEAITALEEMLLSFQGATVFITHDRTLIRRLATRIVELDRGQLVSFPGNYDEYLSRKQQMLEVEARENANFDKFLAEEEVWIRQGIKARRTRNEGRVRRLEALREERRQRVALARRRQFRSSTAARVPDRSSPTSSTSASATASTCSCAI